jgi:transcriptional regulator with XRE-family HTH domain
MIAFGARLRSLRQERGIALKDMAKGLGVSAAYLSALEHGHRGRPNRAFVHRICAYFNIIWDEAEELQSLARLSHPRITVDTAGLSPEATELSQQTRRAHREARCRNGAADVGTAGWMS